MRANMGLVGPMLLFHGRECSLAKRKMAQLEEDDNLACISLPLDDDDDDDDDPYKMRVSACS